MFPIRRLCAIRPVGLRHSGGGAGSSAERRTEAASGAREKSRETSETSAAGRGDVCSRQPHGEGGRPRSRAAVDGVICGVILFVLMHKIIRN